MADGFEIELGFFSPKLDSMTPAQAAQFGAALCRALKERPSERGWHGALYPQNIGYSGGQVSIGAPLVAGCAYSANELEYLPPELFWNGNGGPATDVYSVGLLLYTACSGGHTVFTGEGSAPSSETRAEAAARRLKGEMIRPPKEAGDELSQVILRAVAYREEERWPDVDALCAALEDCSEFSSAEPEEAPTGINAVLGAVGIAGAAAAVNAADVAVPQPIDSGAKPADVAAPEAEKKPDRAQRKQQARAEKEAAKQAEAEKIAAAQQAEAKRDAAAAAMQKPSSKSKKGQAVPENYPRPVYDVFNEKKEKKKRTAVPIIITIIALVALFLGVIYFLGSCDVNEPEPTPTPTVSAEATPTPTLKPTPTPTPEATPDVPETMPPELLHRFDIETLGKGSYSWEAARELCEQQGGHLPIVRNDEDLTKLINTANETGASYVWLDAKRDANGVWRTSDGEELTYLAWFAGEPSVRDTDGTPEDYLMLWKYQGTWGFNDMRANPAQLYPGFYGNKITVICQK